MADSKDKKPEKCLKKSNVLVFQKPVGQRTERKQDCQRLKPPICTPKPKPIRVCTGAELRKMCAPKVCPCPPVKRGPSLKNVLGFGAKSALAATLVYISYDMGIWGSTKDTHELYRNACAMWGTPQPKKSDKWEPPSCEAERDLFTPRSFSPYGQCDDTPIRTEDFYETLKNWWNRGVTFVFHGISGHTWKTAPQGDPRVQTENVSNTEEPVSSKITEPIQSNPPDCTV